MGRRATIIAGTLVVAAGCGGEVEPVSGTWTYDNEIVVENTCGPAIPYEPTQGDFTLENNGDGTLTIDPDDGAATFECTLDRREYTCPERVQEVVELTADATAEVSVSIVGTFRDDTEAEGLQTAVLTCLDAGCQTLASLAGVTDPCTISVEFDARVAE